MNRILIVEDEERIANFMAKGLQKNGFTTEIARDGEQALLMVQDHKFDLLLLDLSLPVKDGWEVMRELKLQKQTIPVIVVTADEDIKSKNISFDYLSKPFYFKELLMRVEAGLKKLV